jgi:alpha-1,3-mannosyltransferase
MTTNILHTSRRFYPGIGGVETHIREIASHLSKKGIKNSVLTLNYDILDPKIKFPNNETLGPVSIYRIPGIGPNKKKIPLKLPLRHFEQADIIHVHDLRFLFETIWFFKHIFRYKIAVSTHGFLFHTDTFSFIKRVLFTKYYRPIINQFVDAVICVSKQDYDLCVKMNVRNLYLIENGVDIDRFGKIARKPIKGEYLYFGRIDYNKKLDQLFMMLSYLKNMTWHLNIVGNGDASLIQSLRTLAAKKQIDNRITWHGLVDDVSLDNFLSRAELCFFPSTYEGFGFTLVEAMAAGCVCIAHSNTAYQNLINNDINGYIANFKEPADAANRISLAVDKNSYLKISEAAKDKAKLYNWENKVEKIYYLYNSIIGNS